MISEHHLETTKDLFGSDATFGTPIGCWNTQHGVRSNLLELQIEWLFGYHALGIIRKYVYIYIYIRIHLLPDFGL